MQQQAITTWNQEQSQRRFYAPGLGHWIAYHDMYPFGPNQIPAGHLSLFYADKAAIISDWAAGPPVWSEDGSRFAFPQCYLNLFRKRFQRIVLVNAKEQTITVYKQKFTNLHLRRIEGNIVVGRDAGERIKLLAFNLDKESIKLKMKYQSRVLQLS